MSNLARVAPGSFSIPTSMLSRPERDGHTLRLPCDRRCRVYGRGAADAKGPLAAMAVALTSVCESGAISRGEVILAAVSDEEGESSGPGTCSGVWKRMRRLSASRRTCG